MNKRQFKLVEIPEELLGDSAVISIMHKGDCVFVAQEDMPPIVRKDGKWSKVTDPESEWGAAGYE